MEQLQRIILFIPKVVIRYHWGIILFISFFVITVFGLDILYWVFR